MNQKFTLIFLFVFSLTSYCQKINLEKYQYIIVPEKFEFLKEKDQYQTSGLTKFLFQKKGFQVFLSGEKLPDELRKNRCLALTAEVKDKSSMITIKNFIEIKDCDSKVVYTSQMGKSKIKEYKKGYHKAIRKAFDTMTDFEYSFKIGTNTVAKEKKVNAVIADVESNKQNNVSKVLVNNTDDKKFDVLYAQKKLNGFQLVDTKPEIIFQILNTDINNVYILKDKNGILFKKDDYWIAQYYLNGNLITKKYDVKF